MYYLAIIASVCKSNDPCRTGKERIITSPADVIAWMDAGTSLPHDDAAGQNLLSGVNLDAKHLGLGVAAIFGGAYPFLVCHIIFRSIDFSSRK